MSLRVTLTFANTSHRGRVSEFLGPDRLIIGRGESCELALPKTPEFGSVSRRHCAVLIEEEAVRVCDMGSRNGTFVNGRQLPPFDPRDADSWAKLAVGDELRVAGILFIVDVEPEADAPIIVVAVAESV